MDTSELIVIAIVAVLGAVLLVIAVRWRRMVAESPGLPLWGVLRLEGIARRDAADVASAKTVNQAELACSVCGSRAECRARHAAGGDATPPASCPNAPLYADFGIAVDKARK